MKLCNKCKQSKSIDLFWKDKYTKDGMQNKCIKCSKILMLNYRTPEKTKEQHLKRMFNISLIDYYKMLDEQMGVCAICLNTETMKQQNGNIKDLSVDHCHETGKIRGLLCYSCNFALGNFKDNMFTLYNAFEYLNKNSL